MPSNQKRVVLIVGDSFIDENWLMSRGDIYHSYNVGKEHYISNLPNADCRIISFCGAASVWRTLRGPGLQHRTVSAGKSMVPSMVEKCELLLLTAWNPSDSNLLMCLLCDKKDVSIGLTPYRLSGLTTPHWNSKAKRWCPHLRTQTECCYQRSMFNLVKTNCPKAATNTSSNHLVRLYEGFGSDQPRLQYRFDWKLDLDNQYKNYGIVGEIKKSIPKTEVDAIVAVDHGYGVIDNELVKRLHRAFPKAKWYIRSKLESATWMDELKKARKKPRLTFTDEQLLEYTYGVRVWRHGPTVLGHAALEVLGDLLGLKKYLHTKTIHSVRVKPENAALLFEDDTVIAATSTTGTKRVRGRHSNRSREKDDAYLVNIASAPGEKKPICVGRSTVFFSSLVYWDQMFVPLRNSMSSACSWALRNAYLWTDSCTKAWLEKKPSNLTGPFDQAIYRPPWPPAVVGPRQRLSHRLTYLASWHEWNRSSIGQGVVTVGGEKQIHLWRAHGTLKDYICPGGDKRSEINKLITRLQAYGNERDPRYPFNCLLLAEPGWGKSTLAKCLAQHFDFQHLSFSVAQMASNQDLMNSLKQIMSVQNRTRARVLVFVDEIDAQIESHTAMGLLLGPIWDGSFASEGTTYRIEPCVWVFASTKPLNHLRVESKGRDFLSRINGPIIELDFFGGDRREKLHAEQDEERRKVLMKRMVRSDPESKRRRTELVYHGVNFLNRVFGPISSIDQNVLRVFYNAMPFDGIRSIEILASRFHDISLGQVTMRNVPRLDSYPELGRHIQELEPWPHEDAKKPVKVITNPPK
ncbi:MAG: AAA family ATPase [Candidatus Eisenbacteria bacterium]|nr:AAA family ATPase [Candidatus Eisenbacteria bacterium]